MENDNWTCINIIKSESAAAYRLNVMKFYITGVKSLSFQDLYTVNPFQGIQIFFLQFLLKYTRL